MSVQSARAKAVRFEWQKGYEDDVYEQLRHAAASKLCTYREHSAGGGSLYIIIDDTLKLRFADHENISSVHEPPDYNFVNEDPSEEELKEIITNIEYPKLCKKLAFAMHVGLSAQKLKKILPPEEYPHCYEEVCENDYYFNTKTQFVVVAAALAELEKKQIMTRIPVRQETLSEEDYSGNRF